jgi:hypothetical protein
LTADGPVRAFYRIFGEHFTKVTYTLVVTRHHLPVRIDIDIWADVNPELTFHSLYSATYRPWGGNGTITSVF